MSEISVSPLFLRGSTIKECIELTTNERDYDAVKGRNSVFIFEIMPLDRQYDSDRTTATKINDRFLKYLPVGVRRELAKILAAAYSEEISEKSTVDTSELRKIIDGIDCICPGCRGSGRCRGKVCNKCNGTGQKLVQPIKPPSKEKPGLKPCKSK